MDNTKLVAVLTLFEGRVDRVYKDTLGLKTAGVGHLLTGKDSDLEVGSFVTFRQVDDWLEQDIRRSILLAQQIIPGFDKLTNNRKIICVSLTFNLGNKLKQFIKFLDAMSKNDYQSAAKELMDSKWAEQVKSRAELTCDALVNDSIEFT